MIESGTFGDAGLFAPILAALSPGNDYYLLAYDFPSYVEAQVYLLVFFLTFKNKVDECYRNPYEWTRKSILSTAGSGKFSSDRTIRQYAEQIWQIQPVRRPGPVSVSVERLQHIGVVSGDVVSPLGASPSSAISLERMTPRSVGNSPKSQHNNW